jgi:S-adenosylmethionine-diacylglycerol 3-amino-3-carboxypropyl transferase
MKNNKSQVQLSELIFTMSWEDPECDRKALRIQPTDNLVTVTSGGCNTLTLLLENPREIFAVDINPAQSYVLELKMAAMRRLEYFDFLGFLGVHRQPRRKEIFGRLEGDLSPDARAFWRSRMPLIDAGFLGKGKYEKFIRMFRTILRLLQGRGRIERMFANDTLEKQRAYFDEVWNTRRWQGLFKIFFSKKVLGRRGLSADYFQFDDGSASFAESFFRRARHAMADLPIKGNYFLAQYLLGRYLDDSQLPEYLLEGNFKVIRKRLDRIRVITSDLKQWLEDQPAGAFDCYALSNICELMNHHDTLRTFREVVRTARPRARMSFRNLMINRTVPDDFKSQVLRDDKLSKELKSNDRSFVYSRVDALYLSSLR